jgi:TolB-like protein
MNATEQPAVASHEIESALSHILASPDFAASPQLASFLRYIVLESLAGRSEHLKERNVARGALGRDADFDPRLDCVVRVVAGKLRRALERFYAGHGAAESLRIEVPKGSYSPYFRHNGIPPGNHGATRDHVHGRGRPTIAIVPLRPYTGGAKERFLANLLVDDVLLRLSRQHRLMVIDCLATGSTEAVASDPCTLAARLHADFVLAGTVTRVGRGVRLTVRMIDVASGQLVWADQYDREIDNGPLVQQDDIADRIVAGVSKYFADATSLPI